MIDPVVATRGDVLATARTQLDLAKLVLCDVDGCLVESDALCAGAAAFVARHGERLRLVTNNSTMTAAALSAYLGTLGLDVPAARCFLAGEMALAYTRDHYPGLRVLAVATLAIRRQAEALGLHLTDARPDVVVLCNDPMLDIERLQQVITAAHCGVPVIVANPDRWRPDRAGTPLIETGTLLAALRAAVPRATVTIVGKPSLEMFRRALEGVSPTDAVMVGDNRETDVAGAERLGITAIHIGRSREAIAPQLLDLMER
ncbi:MAG: hypothetical protein B7Z40_15520 [Bosea sp. 12-68-7]|nr:MAG: hypothetical protein B7Z40_15520 [Bosea sp. 12-68-7]OYW98952.1 MAG: hypothetical protein B7Z14_13330 [Bosea sp. 32-68-6]